MIKLITHRLINNTKQDNYLEDGVLTQDLKRREEEEEKEGGGGGGG